MGNLNRRSALIVGASALASVAAVSSSAEAAMYPEDAGAEVVPGIRLVELGKRESMIPAYKEIAMLDLIFAPGAVYPEEAMQHDMVCQCIEGELQIKQGDMEFSVKPGDVYSCGKGTPEQATNAGNGPAVMRVIEMHA
jgi:quercetin dioxygenase-like cupin family protein